ncbi:TetR/AcrR family transcriptional regulator [Vallitalea okinawensis]|uniref:TetR/AcrR family transcriptional regulator n=1 Tax=Vallitalea okinawensis TaxID=2078660 RepID=UPI000CFD9F8D|nr:TetR/AcrR family transcriptional regulator [Vallitalea okinawensis]
MPKETFYNLQEEKRSMILKIAIEEFQKKGFDKASISNIVKDAGIAKGSFYQYFSDKKDLFKYIIDQTAVDKEKYLRGILDDIEQIDFFIMLRKLYVAGIQYSNDHPKEARIVNSLINGTNQLKEEMLGDVLEKGVDFYEGLLQLGIKKGTVNQEIDVRLVAIMINDLSTSLSEHYLKNENNQDVDTFMRWIDQMLYVLKNGIGGVK